MTGDAGIAALQHIDNHNFGLMVPKGCVIVDIDNYHKRSPDDLEYDNETLEIEKADEIAHRLIADGHQPFQSTPRGGMYFAFKIPAGFTVHGNTHNGGSINVDVRTKGAYVVRAPAHVDELDSRGIRVKGDYESLQALPPADEWHDIPNWFCQLMEDQHNQKNLKSTNSGQSQNSGKNELIIPEHATAIPRNTSAQAVELAGSYMRKMDDSISGNRGHDRLMNAIRHIYHGFDLDRADAEMVIAEYNITKTGGYQWSDSEIKHKFDEVEKIPFNKPIGWLLDEIQTEYSDGDYHAELDRFVFDPSSHSTVVDKILETTFTQNGKRILHYAEGKFWIWHTTHYAEMLYSELFNTVSAFLSDRAISLVWLESKKRTKSMFPVTRRSINDIVQFIQNQVSLSQEQIDHQWTGHNHPQINPAHLFAGPTKLYDIISKCFVEPDPNYFIRNVSSIDVDPNATICPAYQQFLHDLFGNDVDHIQLLHEYMGYCMYSELPIHKALMLIGPPRAGKGVLMGLLEYIIGKKHYKAFSTALFSESFGLEGMIGKRISVISDARFNGKNIQNSIEKLLSITGGDSIPVNIKYKPIIDVRFKTKFIIVSNELPILPDSSNVIAKRFVFLQLKNSFLGHEDIGLLDKLKVEAPAILNIWLTALPDLLARGNFTTTPDQQAILDEMLELGNPITGFIRESCDVGFGLTCTTEELYNCYYSWCLRNGVRQLPTNTFGRNLKLVSNVIERKRKKNGYIYEGIKPRFSDNDITVRNSDAADRPKKFGGLPGQ